MELTPKEKAKELVDKFCFGLYPWQIKKAKEYALLCVNETLNTLENIPDLMVVGNILIDQIKYYRKVKDYIN